MKTKCMWKKVSLLWSNERDPANISRSESLIETLEKGLKTCSKLTIKTRATSLTWFWCRYFYPRTYFQLFQARSSVSIVYFEHVCIYWKQPKLNTLIFSKFILQFLIFGSFHNLEVWQLNNINISQVATNNMNCLFCYNTH